MHSIIFSVVANRIIFTDLFKVLPFSLQVTKETGRSSHLTYIIVMSIFTEEDSFAPSLKTSVPASGSK